MGFILVFRQGLGKKLMERVHEYGREVGCTMATVATISFQNALEFCKRLGCVVDFERPGYIKQASAIFLKKNLS